MSVRKRNCQEQTEVVSLYGQLSCKRPPLVHDIVAAYGKNQQYNAIQNISNMGYICNGALNTVDYHSYAFERFSTQSNRNIRHFCHCQGQFFTTLIIGKLSNLK